MNKYFPEIILLEDLVRTRRKDGKTRTVKSIINISTIIRIKKYGFYHDVLFFKRYIKNISRHTHKELTEIINIFNLEAYNYYILFDPKDYPISNNQESEKERIMTNIKVKITRRTFEKHLNHNAPPQGDERWIIGGTIRMHAMWTNAYGTSLRKHDPIKFDVLYNEWKRNKL